MRWFNLPADSAFVATPAKEAASAKAGSPQLLMKDLRGNHAVLVDFWTYSCVNCIRALPHLKSWHERYAKFGLVIVGVHTPEFEFEKNVENVARAVKEFGIEYPVVMDNDYQIRSLYSNDVWSRKFLINKDGQIVYDHAGEGAYAVTEEAIQGALKEIEPKVELPAVSDEEGGGGSLPADSAFIAEATSAEEAASAPAWTSLAAGKVCFPATPETYLGTMRGRAGKIWNFSGDWKIYPEYIEYKRRTENFTDYLSLNFEAVEVNLVMGVEGERPARVRLELNGKFLRELEVREYKMYNLVNQKDFGGGPLAASPKGELKIFAKDQGLRAYAFTFGGCV